MPTVLVSLPNDKTRPSRQRMKSWLGTKRFEPSILVYETIGSSLVVRVLFKEQREAEVFAERFGGHITSIQSAEAT